ncbi:hypothetical protein FKM82_018994 [Ascaphus truei]
MFFFLWLWLKGLLCFSVKYKSLYNVFCGVFNKMCARTVTVPGETLSTSAFPDCTVLGVHFLLSFVVVQEEEVFFFFLLGGRLKKGTGLISDRHELPSPKVFYYCKGGYRVIKNVHLTHAKL